MFKNEYYISQPVTTDVPLVFTFAFYEKNINFELFDRKLSTLFHVYQACRLYRNFSRKMNCHQYYPKMQI